MNKHIIKACIVTVCAVQLYAPAACAVDAFEFSATAANDAILAEGDIIGYTIELTSAADAEDALHVSLSGGLTLDMYSLRITDNQGSLKEADAIFGNDGFILLGEQLTKGDSVTFSAAINGSDTELSCTAEFAGCTLVLANSVQTAQEATETDATDTVVASTADNNSAAAERTMWPWIIICAALALCGCCVLLVVKKRRSKPVKDKKAIPKVPEELAEPASKHSEGIADNDN